jgi:DNA-binding PucR family transcriptional regulator
MNLARTSEQLQIHRNTVRQRLERISRVIGEDWLDSTRRLDVHLALRIWRLQEALPISATHFTRPRMGPIS